MIRHGSHETSGRRSKQHCIRVACIGAGDIVRATHLPVLKAMPHVDVAWITDKDEDRGRRLAKVYGVPFQPLPSSLENLPDADTYLLACPFGVRDPYYAFLRDRGASIYVEKPFARTAGRHAELCSWFPEYALASGLMMRCWGPNLMVRRVLEQQVFGPVKVVRFGFGKPGIVTQGNFYFEAKRGGAGMISEVGIHGIDSCLFIGRAERAEIQHVHTVFDGDLDLHTEARANLVDASGHQLQMDFTVSSLEPTIEGIEIECEFATLFYPLPGQGYALMGENVSMGVSVRPARGGQTYALEPEYVALQPITKFQMFHEYWKLFLDGVQTRTVNWTAASQSLLTTDLIERCLELRSPVSVEVVEA